LLKLGEGHGNILGILAVGGLVTVAMRYPEGYLRIRAILAVNFFKYFAANFNRLGLKKLITTSYDGSPIAGQGTLFPEYDEGTVIDRDQRPWPSFSTM
jgi:hypothetical protein